MSPGGYEGFPPPSPWPDLPSPPGAPAPEEHWSWRRRKLLVSLGILLLILPVLAGAFIRVPYYLISPGEARGVAELIKVKGDNAKEFPPKGKILFTTVSLAGDVNVFEALGGWLDDNVAFEAGTSFDLHELVRQFAGERARALLAGTAAHSMLPLDISPTAGVALTLNLMAHVGGWCFPRGGAQSLANALGAHLRTLGGEIVTGAPIASLDELRAIDGGGALASAIERFLEAHGDLGHAGEDLTSHSWADDVTLLFAELARRLAAPGEDPDARRERLLAEGAAVEASARETLRSRPADLAAFEEILADDTQALIY